MSALTKLHVYPQSFDGPSTRDGHLIGALGRGVHRFGVGVSTSRGGLCLRKCRSFRGEDGGDFDKEDGKGRNRGKSRLKEVKVKKESQFWKFLRSGVLGKFNLLLGSDVERGKLVANMEGLFSSVSVTGYWSSYLLLRLCLNLIYSLFISDVELFRKNLKCFLVNPPVFVSSSSVDLLSKCACSYSFHDCNLKFHHQLEVFPSLSYLL